MLGETSEPFPDEWGETPLAIQNKQNATSFDLGGMMLTMQRQIEKAAANHDDEVVAVMKEIRKLLMKGQITPLTSGENGMIIKSNDNHDPQTGQFTDGGGSGGGGESSGDSSGGSSSGSSKGTTGRYGTSKIIGQTTSTGKQVNSVSGHAVQRMRQRHVTAAKVAATLTSSDTKVTPGHTPNTKVYYNEKDGTRVVFDEATGNVVTCMIRKG